MPWREHSVPGSARAARAEAGAGLAPRPPHPCRQRWLRAGLRRGVLAGGGEGGSEPGRAREPGPAPSAALTSAPSAPFLPACLGLPAAACPPNAGAATGPGLPRARPGLLPRPLIHGDHSSPVSSAALLPSARPRQPPPCSHTGCLVARTGHWLGAAELGPAWGDKATLGPLLQPLGSSCSRGALGRCMAGPQGLGGQGQRAVAMPTAEHAHPWPWAESGAVSAS